MSDAVAQKKAKKPAEHPKYSEMVIAAIATLKDRAGSSRKAIKTYITANYKVGDNAGNYIRLALKRLLEKGTIVHPKNKNGSFKLNKEAVVPKKPAKKPAAKKPVAKKPAAKKPAAKKPAAKKASKSPKKKTAKSPAKKTKKPTKKPAVKKPSAKPKPAKKAAAKKPVAKKAAKKPAKKAAKK